MSFGCRAAAVTTDPLIVLKVGRFLLDCLAVQDVVAQGVKALGHEENPPADIRQHMREDTCTTSGYMVSK
jgi:hypothetical protein